MFAISGTFLVIWGFCGFLVYRMPMEFVAALLIGGLLLFAYQLGNGVRIYWQQRREQMGFTEPVSSPCVALIAVPAVAETGK